MGARRQVDEVAAGESSRRRFLAAGGLVGATLLAGCAARDPGAPAERGSSDSAAELGARPEAQPSASTGDPAPGVRPLGLEPTGDPLLYVPAGLTAGAAAGLVLSLHGAGGDAAAGLGLFQSLADERGLVLLAPASRGPTWDAIGGSYGADAESIDRALRRVFATVRVDPDRVAVAGFSDGGSYALGLGLANGDLFGRVVAFSPGFVPRGPRNGQPAVFVSHGDADDVLPVDRTSWQIVPALREDGYDVTYREFAGPHTVPPEIAREAADWLG